MKKRIALAVAVAGLFASSAAPPAAYSVLIRGGTIYDGSGGAPYVGDVAMKGDKIAYVGPHAPGRAARDGRRHRQGRLAGLHQHAELGERKPDRRRPRAERHAQGVTLEVMGEGDSMGPLTPEDEAAGGQAAGRHQISDQLDDARPISRISAAARASRPTSPRSSARPRCACTSSARRTSTRPPPSSTRMRALVRAGDEGRRDGRRLVADLRAGHLRRDAGADRADHRGRRSAAACTSATCAPRGTSCSKRSTS